MGREVLTSSPPRGVGICPALGCGLRCPHLCRPLVPLGGVLGDIKHPGTTVAPTPASRKVVNSAPAQRLVGVWRFGATWVLPPAPGGPAWYGVDTHSVLLLRVFRTSHPGRERVRHGQQNIHLCQRFGPGLCRRVGIRERLGQKLAADGAGFPECIRSPLLQQVSLRCPRRSVRLGDATGWTLRSPFKNVIWI